LEVLGERGRNKEELDNRRLKVHRPKVGGKKEKKVKTRTESRRRSSNGWPLIEAKRVDWE